jgi:ABC transporter with metal-binding/Fe-S-binding domain ATP-binding protein
LKVSCLVSGGKDSIFALWCALHQYEVTSIINIQPKSSDSQLYHAPNTKHVKLIAKMLNLPLIEVKSISYDLSEEIELLTKTIIKSKTEAIITGGLRSEFQRYSFNRAALKAKVHCFNPLWRLAPRILMDELLSNHFHIILVSVASMGLKKSLLGKKITSELLKEIQASDQVSDLVIAGEGGEYESFVLDAPFFPSRIQITESKVHWNEFREVGYLEIVKAALVPKKTD